MTVAPALPVQLQARPQRTDHRLPMDAATIEQLRSAVLGAIDPSYEAFLLAHGGVAFSALVEFALPSASPWGERGTLTELFGRFDDGRGDLITELATFAPVLGPGLLPIGRDPGGNLVVLRCGPDPALGGGVWFWDHEARPTGVTLSLADLLLTDSGEQLYRLAPSFAEFVDGLTGRAWD